MRNKKKTSKIRSQQKTIRCLASWLIVALIFNMALLVAFTVMLNSHAEEPVAEEKVATQETHEYVYSTVVPLSLSLQHKLQDACFEYNVPYALALAVIEQESAFDETADNGICYGLMQLHPINYPRLRELGYEPLEPEGNLYAGVYMLSELLTKYPDNHQALMAYNLGETGAKKLWNEGQYCSQYSMKVLSLATKWQSETTRY